MRTRWTQRLTIIALLLAAATAIGTRWQRREHRLDAAVNAVGESREEAADEVFFRRMQALRLQGVTGLEAPIAPPLAPARRRTSFPRSGSGGVDVLVNDPSLDTGDNTTQSETSLAVYGATLCAGYNDSNNMLFPFSTSGVSRSPDLSLSWADRGVTSTILRGGDPGIAVHRADGTFYYVEIDGSGDLTPGGTLDQTIGVSRSVDGCQTFAPGFGLASTGISTSRVCRAPDIHFFNSCAHNSDCDTTAGSNDGVCSSVDRDDKPSIAVDNSGGPHDGNVYVCWTRLADVGTTDLRFARSLDGGVTFQPEEVISTDPFPFACHLDVGPSGDVYATWAEGGSPNDIRFGRSVDGGASWDAVRTVNHLPVRPPGTDRMRACNFLPGGSQETRPTLNGDIRMLPQAWVAVDTTGGPYSGNLYVVWASDPAGATDNSDIYFSRSGNGGLTWSPEIQLSGDTATDQFEPYVAVGGSGAVSVAWYDRRNDTANNFMIDVYTAFSRDGGATFGPLTRLSDQSFGVPPINGQPTTSGNFDSDIAACYMGEYIGITADAARFYYVWGDNRDTLTTAGYPSGRPDPNVYADSLGAPPVVDSVAESRVWTSIGPDGGQVSAIAIDPNTPATMYAATRTSGVFKSTNGGVSWSEKNVGLSNLGVSGLVLDPSTSTTLYISTLGHGVLKSTDGADTWASVGFTGMSDTFIEALAVDPTDGNVLLAGTESGIFRTTDGGSNWSLVASGPSVTRFLAFAFTPTNHNVVYAGSFSETNPGQVLKSTDAGATWSPAGSGLSNSVGFGVFSLSVDPTNANTIYAGTNLGPYQSTNAAGSWTSVVGNLPYAYAFNAIIIDPTNSNRVYGGASDSGVFKTTDGGTTWTNVSTGLGAQSIQTMALDPSNVAHLYAGTYGAGVYATTNSAASWTRVSIGLRALLVDTVAVDPTASATLFAGTAGAGIFKSSDSGATWNPVNGGLQPSSFVDALAIDPSNSSSVYAAINGVFKSVDGGANWTEVDTGFGARSLAIDPVTPATVYAGGGGGVFKTTDAGSNWAAVNSGLSGAVVTGIAINPSDTQTVYAATTTGLFKTTNGGTAWSESDSGLTMTDVSAVAVDQTTPTRVYAGTYGAGVFKSVDGGATWTAANAGVSSTAVLSVAVDPVDGDVVYAATLSGTYLTINGGTTWTPLDDGLASGFVNRYFNALAIDPFNHRSVYAGSGSGVFALQPACGATPLSNCTGSQAATGTCSLQLTGASGLNGTFTFDPGTLDVFGTSVDLATNVGSLTLSGALQSFNGSTGTVPLHFAGTNLTFDVTAHLKCPATGCLSSDRATLGGDVQNLTGGALPGGAFYEFDGAVSYDPALDLHTGPCSINAFAPINTPTGTNVKVVSRSGIIECGQGVIDAPVEITFPSVSSGGSTLVTSACDVPGTVPPNLQVEVDGLKFYFDVTTSAGVSFPATVCFDYPASLDPVASDLHLLHGSGGAFTIVTNETNDTFNRQLCGQVDSLSPFVVAVATAAPSGVIPPDTGTRKCEGKVARKLGALARKLASCAVKAATAAVGGHSFNLAACEAAAQGKFDIALATLTGCPVCVTANQEALRNQLTSAIQSMTGGAYCSGATPLGGDFGFAPDATSKKCENGVATQAGKLARAITLCGMKAANAAAANRSFDRPACETAAGAAYDRATAGLSGCPVCAAANLSAIRAQMDAYAAGAAASVFCEGTTPLP